MSIQFSKLGESRTLPYSGGRKHSSYSILGDKCSWNSSQEALNMQRLARCVEPDEPVELAWVHGVRILLEHRSPVAR